MPIRAKCWASSKASVLLPGTWTRRYPRSPAGRKPVWRLVNSFCKSRICLCSTSPQTIWIWAVSAGLRHTLWITRAQCLWSPMTDTFSTGQSAGSSNLRMAAAWCSEATTLHTLSAKKRWGSSSTTPIWIIRPRSATRKKSSRN